MKLNVSVLTILLWVSSAQAADHPLGMPNEVFCDALVKAVTPKMPMRYTDFIKLTDGEGMPVAAERRHWDGLHGSYLSIDLHLGLVKGGAVTCPNGKTKTFGVWDIPN